MDWDIIKNEYISTDTSYSDLAHKYGISYSRLWYRAKKEDWHTLKINPISEKPKDPISRITSAADKLLSRIEQATEELDLHIVKNKVKTKTIEYSDESGKAEKEIICEDEAIGSDKGVIDRVELKQLVATLKDIKEIYFTDNNTKSDGELESLIKGLNQDD